jgi:hypothetical protein
VALQGQWSYQQGQLPQQGVAAHLLLLVLQLMHRAAHTAWWQQLQPQQAGQGN